MKKNLVMSLVAVSLTSSLIFGATVPVLAHSHNTTGPLYIREVETSNKNNSKIELELSSYYTWNKNSTVLVKDANGNIIDSKIVEIDDDDMELITSTPLVTGATYTITLSNLTDYSGKNVNTSITFVADPNIETRQDASGNITTFNEYDDDDYYDHD